MRNVLMRGSINSPNETNEISMNGNLCYCSRKEERGSAREDRPTVSEGIGKSAIKGYLICFLDYSTYVIAIRAKTPELRIVSNKIAS